MVKQVGGIPHSQRKGTLNAQVSLQISRQPRQQKIYIFASYNPSFSQSMTLKNETLQLNIYCETHFYPYNIFFNYLNNILKN